MEVLTDMVQYAIDIGTNYSIGDLDFGLQHDTATFELPAEVGCHADLVFIACELFRHHGNAAAAHWCMLGMAGVRSSSDWHS